VALIGYGPAGGEIAGGFVLVADPKYGHLGVPYEVFRTAYHKTGTWTHSYRCK
jgi:hypothetical protein